MCTFWRYVIFLPCAGVCVQTETVLRQALTERIKPILMVNKIDRCILEKQLEPEELYQHLWKVIDRVNSVVDTYKDDSCPMGDLTVSYLTFNRPVNKIKNSK